MKYQPTRTSRFKKDVKLAKKRSKDLVKLKDLMVLLIQGTPLNKKYRDHPLVGPYKDHRECHIEPDWLLIYKLDGEEIIFERTGSHADLFR